MRYAFAFVLFAIALCRPAWADGPADLINRIYDHYRPDAADTTSLLDDHTLLSRRLNGLFADYDKRQTPDEVGSLDFDPFISAQDYVIKDVSIASEAVEGEKATIVVRFTNFGDGVELTYSLVREGGAWKVDDIKSGNADDAWVLSDLLTAQ